MLDVRDLHVYYGEIHALKGISFRVTEGEIVTLLGNNGAGKSTTLKTLSGLLAPRTGTVLLDGASLAGTPPHGVVQRGVTHVPEGRRIFNRLTVQENLTMGAYKSSNDLSFGFSGGSLDMYYVSNLATYPNTLAGQAGLKASEGAGFRLATVAAIVAGKKVVPQETHVESRDALLKEDEAEEVVPARPAASSPRSWVLL